MTGVDRETPGARSAPGAAPGPDVEEPPTSLPTLGELLATGRTRLRSAPFPIEPREATLLLARACGRPEAWVLAHPEVRPEATQGRRFLDWLERRLRGEPAAHLFGEREFWGRPFDVDRRVLIPRPETEHLVEIALDLTLPPRSRVLDVGTGSGCLAVTLALERPTWRLMASDRSTAALAVARRNVERHGLTARLSLVAADLLDAFRPRSFDLVVANLPYVDPDDASRLSTEVTAFEPASALFAPERGLALYRRLLTDWRPASTHARLLIEIGAGQLDAILDLARKQRLRALEVRSDLAGHPRSILLAAEGEN